jgi:opacity protein-like surface antigen
MKRVLTGLGVCILIAMFVSLIPMSVMAQTQTGYQYKMDMAVNLDWMTLDPEGEGDVDLNTYTVALDLGYFINDMFEVGPEVSYTLSEMEIEGESIETTSWSFVVKGNAHFSTNTEVMPYVGLRVGLSSLDMKIPDFVDTDDTAFTYGAQLGLDYFITNNVSVNPELRYTRTSYEFEGVDIDADDISFMIGFGIFF